MRLSHKDLVFTHKFIIHLGDKIKLTNKILYLKLQFTRNNKVKKMGNLFVLEKAVVQFLLLKGIVHQFNLAAPDKRTQQVVLVG